MSRTSFVMVMRGRGAKDQGSTCATGHERRVLSCPAGMDDRDYQRYVHINLPHARNIVQRMGRSLDALRGLPGRRAGGRGGPRTPSRPSRPACGSATRTRPPRSPFPRRTRRPRGPGRWWKRSSRRACAATGWASTCATSSSAWAWPRREPPSPSAAASGPTRRSGSAKDRESLGTRAFGPRGRDDRRGGKPHERPGRTARPPGSLACDVRPAVGGNRVLLRLWRPRTLASAPALQPHVYSHLYGWALRPGYSAPAKDGRTVTVGRHGFRGRIPSLPRAERGASCCWATRSPSAPESRTP